MADRIVVMRDGTVEQVGAPLDLYDRPVNRFVAGFIGSPAMNILDGAMTDAGFTLTDGTLLPFAQGARTAVACGLRPEHVALRGDGIEVEAVVVESAGAETQVAARIGGQPLVVLLRERMDIRPGQKLHVTAAPAHVHLFDGDGVRIDPT